ncbi:putative sulfotransferase [Ixodes scapularis]
MSPKRFPAYQDIDGVKYALGYRAVDIREALSYMPRNGDIVMVSHLKCGNNWLEQIMQLILYKGQSAKTMSEFHQRTPYLELVGTSQLEAMPPPRFYKTHFPYELQPINSEAKYVYITRNPLDVCVSFYHYTCLMPIYKFDGGAFDDFFELFVTGQTDHGDIIDHLVSWYKHKDDNNVLILTYEDLKRDFRNTVLRLAFFLGEEYARSLERDEELYQGIVEQSSISFMSKFLFLKDDKLKSTGVRGEDPYSKAVRRFLCDEPGQSRRIELVRKGAVGDWKTLFKRQHLDRLRCRIQEKGATQILQDLWNVEDLGELI